MADRRELVENAAVSREEALQQEEYPVRLPEIRRQLSGKTLMLVPYMHADWAWCHTRLWHEIRYVSIFEDLIALLESGSEFRWYMDCYRTEVQPLLDRRPDLIPRLRAFVESGKVGVCGGFSNVRPNMVEDETYVRNMVIGRARFLSLFPGAEMLVQGEAVDTALGHPQIPQLIKKGGFRYYRAGRPYAVLAHKGIDQQFLWEGLDGTVAPVWWGEYGGICFPESVAKVRANEEHWEETVEHLFCNEMGKAENSRLDVIPVPQGCDDCLPLKAFNFDMDVDLPGLARMWNERETSSMVFGTPNDFFRLLDERRERLKLHKGTLDICDVCYNVAWGGEQGMIALRMETAERLVECERWEALAQMLGVRPAADLTREWENHLLSCAHATAWLYEKDFQEVYGIGKSALLSAEQRIREAQDALTRRMALPKNTVGVFFNAFERDREEIVQLTIPCGRLSELELCDGEGNPVEWQMVSPYEYTETIWEYEIAARLKVPALGYNSLVAKAGKVDCRYGAKYEPPATLEKRNMAKPVELDNGLLRLRFVHGKLSEVTDLETGAEVYAGAATPWNALRFTKVDTDNGVLHAGPFEYTEDAVFTAYTLLEQGPLRWKVRLDGQLGHMPVSQTVTLQKGSRELGFEVEIDWQKAMGFLSCAVPTQRNGRLYGGIPFGIEQKDVLGESYGRLEDEGWSDMHRQFDGLFFAKDFAAARGEAHAVSLCHTQGDRFYFYDRNSGDLSYVLINSARLFEDTWEKSVNHMIAAEGKHCFRYAVGIYGEATPNEELSARARQLRSPIRQALPYRSSEPAVLPARAGIAACSGDGIGLSAIYADGDGYLLRLWNNTGEERTAEIALPAPVRSVGVQDFIGGPGEGREAAADGKEIRVSVKPWEIVTLRLTL